MYVALDPTMRGVKFECRIGATSAELERALDQAIEIFYLKRDSMGWSYVIRVKKG